jgi:hypothetical protein
VKTIRSVPMLDVRASGRIPNHRCNVGAKGQR